MKSPNFNSYAKGPAGMKETDIIYIIEDFKKGSTRALNYIYNLFYNPLCYFAGQLVSKEEAEDIVTDTFVKLWLKHEDFHSLQGIKAFLYIAVRNSCLDH